MQIQKNLYNIIVNRTTCNTNSLSHIVINNKTQDVFKPSETLILDKLRIKYPDIHEKYLSFLSEIKIQSGEFDFRNLTIEELDKILKSKKTTKKFTSVFCSFPQNVSKNLSCKINTKPGGTGSVPRYIYHMTNRKNYLEMCKTGQINTSRDDFIGQGIFMIDLENFFKHWGKGIYNNNSHFYQSNLIEHCLKDSFDLVILRIPTKNLEHENLRIRSQNRLFSSLAGDRKELLDFIKQDSKNTNYTKGNVSDSILCSINKYFDKLRRQGSNDHIYNGSPVCKSKLFKQRKEAIEYVYRKPIPMENIEKIGEIDIEELMDGKYSTIYPIKKIFGALLHGTPESKGVKLIND